MTIHHISSMAFTRPTGAPDASGDFIQPGAFSECAIVIDTPLPCGELQELKAQWEQLFKGSTIATVTILELGK